MSNPATIIKTCLMYDFLVLIDFEPLDNYMIELSLVRSSNPAIIQCLFLVAVILIMYPTGSRSYWVLVSKLHDTDWVVHLFSYSVTQCWWFVCILLMFLLCLLTIMTENWYNKYHLIWAILQSSPRLVCCRFLIEW